jgi:membrane-associated protease RseP (regulator of RpoE activity)
MSAQPLGVEETVRSLFSVKESFMLPDGELEFQVAYDAQTKLRFAELKSRLEAQGYRPELTGTSDDCVLILRKPGPVAKALSRVPAGLALFTLAAVVFSAILQQEVYHVLVPSWPYYFSFLSFALTVMLILGAHELGQRLMARARDAGHASSYLIPGIPFIPPFLPSLGFATSQREPALNRDSLFDTVMAGPLVMLVFAMALYAVGTLTAVQSTVAFASTSLNSTTVTVNPSAIQVAIGTLLSPYSHPIAAGYVAVSPVADGSFVGFILTFLALLPMAYYDGGLLASVAWGQRVAKAATYLSIGVLLVLDTWTYWAIAVIALLLAGRPVQVRLQDEVSPLSSSRRWVLVGTIVLAFLCLPIPNNLATLPLP